MFAYLMREALRVNSWRTGGNQLHTGGVPDGRRVEQVLVPALLLEGHITPMLLEATLVLEAELVARAPDLVVIADEELVHKHRVRMRVGDQGQPLSER